jgi:phosphoadenosine phosphosulfate reductase
VEIKKEELGDLSPEYLTNFEGWESQGLIAWTLERFGSRAAICTSFQAEGMVILDQAVQIDPTVRVFTIDTGRLSMETSQLIDQVRDRYQISIEVYHPDQTELNQLVSKNGMNPFYASVSLRMRCCEIRKLHPLEQVLPGLDAWITGLRRSQSNLRGLIPKVSLDQEHGNILKVNPLADWTEEQVWDYIKEHEVPYNQLYDQGYTSIGCAPCTRPVTDGEGPRAGRWWWETSTAKECGIHFNVADVGEFSS